MSRAEELRAIERAVNEGRVQVLPAQPSPDCGRVRMLGQPYLAPVPMHGASGQFFTGGYRVLPKRIGAQ